MPTYEYECKECGHNFEVFQSMSDEPLKHCVKCGKEVRRLIFGGVGVIFKGSGFYVTDKAVGRGKRKGGETKTEQTSSASPATGDAKKPAGDGAASKAATKDSSVAKDAAVSTAKPSAQSA